MASMMGFASRQPQEPHEARRQSHFLSLKICSCRKLCSTSPFAELLFVTFFAGGKHWRRASLLVTGGGSGVGIIPPTRGARHRHGRKHSICIPRPHRSPKHTCCGLALEVDPRSLRRYYSVVIVRGAGTVAHRAEEQANLLVVGGQLDAVGAGLLGAIVGAKVILRAGQARGGCK